MKLKAVNIKRIRPFNRRYIHGKKLRADLRRLCAEHKYITAAAGVFLLVLLFCGVTWYMNAQRYVLSSAELQLLPSNQSNLVKKLSYDNSKKAFDFNALANEKGPDVLQTEISGGKSGTPQYSARLAVDPKSGVTLSDEVNHLSVKVTPEFAAAAGKMKEGRVIYPLNSQSGQAVYSLRANGVKEDILLKSSSADRLDFSYRLSYPSDLQPKLMPDGSVGFYSGNPVLYGNITYGSASDKLAVEKARQSSPKVYLMFVMPAPIIKEYHAGSQPLPKAKFILENNKLILSVSGLSKASYPLAIDPTFLVSTTQDWTLGSVEDNVDLSQANQVGRAALTGGSLQSWSNSAYSMPASNYDMGVVAYNGYLYVVGGNGASNTVYYAPINLSTGNLSAAFTKTTSFTTGRIGDAVFGYNGYLYVVGGEDSTGSTQYKTIEYAPINQNGSLGTFVTNANSMITARADFASAIYQGVIYVMGGETSALNATLTNTTEYARVNGDGSIGAWQATTSLTSARDRFSGASYNGRIYIAGGLTNSTTVTNIVQYANINSDGTLGSWVTTTSFLHNKRDMGMAVVDGYIYIFGGCESGIPCTTLDTDTQYAVINSSGTIGQWQQTNNTAGARGGTDMVGTAYYNGYIYSLGGCSTENLKRSTFSCSKISNQVFFTSFDSPGRFDNGIESIENTPPYNNSTPTTALMGGQAIALNGYMYYISGCSVSGCASYNPIVEYAPINANGSLGTFSTTSSLIGDSGDNAGRIGFTLAAYNNEIYVIGGIEKTTGGTDNFRPSILSATQNATGTLSTWTAQANSLPQSLAFHNTEQWHNYIYVLGGRDASNVYGNIYYAPIQSGGAIGPWNTASQTITARWGASSAIWGNWIYEISGLSNVSGTYLGTAASNGAVQQVAIDNIANVTTTPANYASGTATEFATGFAHNGVLYSFGGSLSNNTNPTNTIYWTSLNPTTGAPGTFSNTNIGNYGTPYGLATSRNMPAGTDAGGYFYIIGGCSSSMANGSYSACTGFVSTANNTEVYLPNNGGTGQTEAFSATQPLSASLADEAAVAYNGKLYVVGGCTAYTAGVCTNNLSSVEYDTINADGSLGASWTSVNGLPSGRSLEQAVAYNGNIYVIGGRVSSSQSTSNTVWYAPVTATGSLGSWVDNSSNYLPSGADRNSFGAAISQVYKGGGVYASYLYVAGGVTSSGTYRNDVYYAPINSDGTIGTWGTTISFNTPRDAFSMIAYNGMLYVVGGYDGSAKTDIQYAAVNASDGSLSGWNYTSDVDRGMNARQVVAANGYIYFIGDEGSGTQIKYASINANGTIGALQGSANGLTAAHPHGAAVMASGVIYVVGGCSLSGNSCTSVTPTVEVGGQQAIARTAHYSKLFNTEVDTSPSELVLQGALSGPGSEVELSLRTASQENPTLGIAQVIRPVILGTYYRVQALDPSGNNVGVAYNYFVSLFLDDSRSGTFPDVNQSSSETSVSSLTLYYHANPQRRLRHGASFTNTGCNTTAALGCILDTAP